MVKEKFIISGKWTCPGGVSRVRVIGRRKVYPVSHRWHNGNQGEPLVSHFLNPFGKAFGMGFNMNGGIGDSSVTQRSVPVAVLAAQNFRAITTSQIPTGGPGSFSFGYALNDQNVLYVWGRKSVNYPLGDGIAAATSSPNVIVGSRQFRKISVNSGGGLFGIGLDNKLWSWGNQNATYPILGLGTVAVTSSPTLVAGNRNVLDVFAGPGMTFFIDENRDGWAMGFNSDCALGNGDAPTPFPTVNAKSSPVAIAGGKKWSKIMHWAGASFGITMDGELYGWGADMFGLLNGQGATHFSTPTLLSTKKWKDVRSYANAQMFALDDKGFWYAWGVGPASGYPTPPVEPDQYNGDIEIGVSTPTIVIGQRDKKYVELFLGNAYFATHFAIDNFGRMWTWGDNGAGQGGTGEWGTSYFSPKLVLAPRPFVFAAQHIASAALFVAADGTVYGSGANYGGMLGDGTIVNKSSPVMVSGPNTSWVQDHVTENTIDVVPGQVYTVNLDGFHGTFGANSMGQECQSIEICYE